MRAALSRGAAVRGGRQRNGKLVVARRSTLNTEALVKLGAERLAELALDEAERNGPFKKLVMAALASERGPEAVAAIVDKRLAGLETARGTIGWGKAKSFGEDLSATLKIITGDLAKADAEAAADRLMRFLATADRTLSRDGSSGDGTAAVYYAAAAALPGLIAKLPPEASLMAADRLYDLTAESRYGVAENSASEILAAAPPVLVEAFDQRLAEGLRALGPFAADDSDWSRHARARRLIELRQRVADARGDVDAFIELETGLPGHFPDPAEIAERLTAAGRHREALDWLRRPSRPSVKRLRMEDLNAGLAPRDPAVDRRQRVEIRVLEALGERAQARALRWKLFEETLDADSLREHLAGLPDFEDVDALDAAFALALETPLVYAALRFLVQWPRLDLAERLVVKRRAQWDGRRYEILAAAAETLESAQPLAATILYRALVGSILERAQSPAYAHAARYYVELESLAAREDPGWPVERAETWLTALRGRHGRKHGFWTAVEAAGRQRA